MSNILTNNINARSGNRIAIGKAGDIVSIAGTLSYEDVSSVDSVGVITARSTIDAQGDVSIADKIIHSGDTNTAIRFPAADTFTVETAGSERVRVTSTGNAGIGTDNPLQKLHLVDDTSANIYLQTHNAGTGSTAGVYFRTSDSSTADGFFKTAIVLEDDGTSWARGKLHFLQNNTANSSNATIDDSVLTINQSGQIGIGLTDPNRLLHLQAASSTAYSGGSDTADYNFLKIENTTDDRSAGVFFLIGSNGEAAITATEVSDGATDITFQNRGGGVRSEKVRIDSSGRLGINTTSFADTATALNIKNGASGNDHTFFDIECNNNESCRVRFSEDGSTYPGEVRYHHSDNSMRFFRGGNEHMRMDGSLRHYSSDASARFTVKNANTSSGSSAFDISNGASNVTDGTQVFSIRENGDIYTSGNTTVQALSSERRLKENIELIDRSVSWATIKNTPYYTYNLIGQEGPRYGPIVDEVPAEMVKATDLSDDQGPIRTFDNGMLNARLYVALQEAITKIETLETKVAALEAN